MVNQTKQHENNKHEKHQPKLCKDLIEGEQNTATTTHFKHGSEWDACQMQTNWEENQTNKAESNNQIK